LKGAIVLFFITATTNIFINAGRTGYVLFIVLMFVLFVMAFRKRVFVAIISSVTLVLVSILLAYSFSTTFQKRLDQTIASIKAIYVDKNYHSSLGARAALGIAGKNLVVDNWLIGVGTGDEMDVVRGYIKEHMPSYIGMANFVQHLHNEYFRAILQFGILGLLSFLYIIYRLLVYEQPSKTLKNTQIFLAISIALFSFVDIVVLGLGCVLTLVLLAGVSLNWYKVSNATFTPLSMRQLTIYGSLVVFLQSISMVS